MPHACPYGGRRVVLAYLTQSGPVKAILDHLGLPSAGPPVAPAQFIAGAAEATWQDDVPGLQVGLEDVLHARTLRLAGRLRVFGPVWAERPAVPLEGSVGVAAGWSGEGERILVDAAPVWIEGRQGSLSGPNLGTGSYSRMWHRRGT